MLDERSRTLLKALVEHYIADGQPVGFPRPFKIFRPRSVAGDDPATSWPILRRRASSPAPYLGRAHSDAQGYRLFVDSLLTVRPLDPTGWAKSGVLQVSQPQQIIANASHLLSSLTHFAGIVVAPGAARRASARWVPCRLPKSASCSFW